MRRNINEVHRLFSEHILFSSGYSQAMRDVLVGVFPIQIVKMKLDGKSLLQLGNSHNSFPKFRLPNEKQREKKPVVQLKIQQQSHLLEDQLIPNQLRFVNYDKGVLPVGKIPVEGLA